MLSLRVFHGKLSKESLFHSPFQPTGEVAGPAAFSISDLGTGLLLPPTPHSLGRNPCCRCVSVPEMEGPHPCLTHFPAALLLVSLISPMSVAERLGTERPAWSRGPCRNSRGAHYILEPQDPHRPLALSDSPVRTPPSLGFAKASACCRSVICSYKAASVGMVSKISRLLVRLSVAEEYLGTSKRNYLGHAYMLLKLQKSVLLA